MGVDLVLSVRRGAFLLAKLLAFHRLWDYAVRGLEPEENEQDSFLFMPLRSLSRPVVLQS